MLLKTTAVIIYSTQLLYYERLSVELLVQFRTECILFIPIGILKVIYMVGRNSNMATARFCSLFLGLTTMTDYCEYGINLRVQQMREVPCYVDLCSHDGDSEEYDLLGCNTP